MRATSKIILCLTLCFLNYSCGQNSKGIENSQVNKTIELNGKTYTLKEGVERLNKKPKSKIIFHDVKDTQRNMTLCYMPLPSDWKQKDQANKDGAYIFGPNNIHVYLPKSSAFRYSQLPGYNQMMVETGQQVKPLKSPERLVKEELEPLFAKDGVKLVKQYHVPELQKYDKNYDQFIFKSIPIRKEFKVLATEWEDNEGNKFLFIIRHNAAYTQEACNWGYIVNMMDAPKTHFENAKNDYLYCLANIKYNPNWLQACYMKDAQIAARNGKLHQQRMAGLRAEGQAIIDKGNAYSAMVDRNHKRFMDAHLERQTVSTTNTNYQVDAGSNVYWINANGEYIPTNDFNFDPNLDPNLNNQTWTKGTNNN